MITLNDMKNCLIDKKDIALAYSPNKFILEVLLNNNEIRVFKYDNENELQNDITRVNMLSESQILYG